MHPEPDPITALAVPVEGRVPDGATNAHLIGAGDALLVDPPARDDRLDAAADRREVRHVAVTHTHPDHADGVATYAERCDVTLWARRGRESRFERATGCSPDRTFSPGDAVPAGDGAVTVLDTPGHAPDHVSFRVGEAILCGDLAVAEGSVAVAAPDGDVRAYLTSLRRLHAMDSSTLYPGHGPAIDDPRTVLARLVDHRLDRERRVLAAVLSGARDPEAVLAAAYDADLTGVRDLARATVVAHLEKLAVERKVRWDPIVERIVPAGDRDQSGDGPPPRNRQSIPAVREDGRSDDERR